jgi:hypothetical protein
MTLTMNSRMEDATEAERLSQQLWRLLTHRRFMWRKPLPYWGLMMMTKGTRRRCIARTLTCDSFGTYGPAKG